MQPALVLYKSFRTTEKVGPCLCVARGGQAAEAMKTEAAVRALGLRHPRDRNGKAIAERYATLELECALEDYRKACAAAHAAVHEQLVLLAKRLEVSSFF